MGPRPPVRVVRPVLPASLLERLAGPEATTQPLPSLSGSLGSSIGDLADEDSRAGTGHTADPGPGAGEGDRPGGRDAWPALGGAEVNGAAVAGARPGEDGRGLNGTPVADAWAAAGGAEPNGAAAVNPAILHDWPAMDQLAPAEPSAGRWFAPDSELAAQPAAAPLPQAFAPAPAPAGADIVAAPRQAAERAPGGQRRSRRRYQIAGVLVAVIALLAGGFVIFMTMGKATVTGRGAAAPRVTPAALATAWVVRQVSPRSVVSCDPVMCQALRAHGFPGGSLLTLRPGTSASPLGSAVVVATPAVRGQFGSQLGIDAPEILARFGSGAGQVEVRVTAPHGLATFTAALGADLVARKLNGGSLATSNRVAVSAAGKRQLSAGQVDSRVLIAITGMASLQPPNQPLSIVAFGDSGPGAGAAGPLRSADFAVPRTGSAAYLRSMISMLQAQHSPYAPARAGTARLPSGEVVLRIEFAAPSPLGLLGPQNGG